MKTKILAIACAASALALGALLLAPMPAQAQQSVLRIGLQEDPDMLDPHRARTFVGRIVFKGLCDKLFDAGPDLALIPRLATEWSFSADGLIATLKLRSGVKFHDGTAFDAAAAKANLDRARTLPESLRRSELVTIDSVDVVDPLTIAIKLKQRDATLLSQLADRAGMMLSPATFAGDAVHAKVEGRAADALGGEVLCEAAGDVAERDVRAVAHVEGDGVAGAGLHELHGGDEGDHHVDRVGGDFGEGLDAL